MNALGIDVANPDKLVNWQVAKDHGVIFAAARASISYAYRDPWFAQNMREMARLSIHRFAYHVLYPDQDPKAQVDNFMAACGDIWADAWPVLDVELDRGMKPGVITTCLVNWQHLAKTAIGKYPLLYSRANWIDEFTVNGEWRQQCGWWIADYLADRTKEQTTPPILPQGVSCYLIHQNADQYPKWPGLNGSADGSVVLDVDRWNGTEADVHAFFGITSVPKPVLTYEQKVDKLWDWATAQGMKP